jgi:hypothetical protein
MVNYMSAREGLPLEEYAYSLAGVAPSHKKLIKATFFKLINAREGQTIRPPRSASLPPGLTWPQLQEAIKDMRFWQQRS